MRAWKRMCHSPLRRGRETEIEKISVSFLYASMNKAFALVKHKFCVSESWLPDLHMHYVN